MENNINIGDILLRIKECRKKMGYTYKVMADELKISSAAYRKIEVNQTKLSLERLFEIAQILNVNIIDIISLNLNKPINEKSNEYLQEIQTYVMENKEKSEKIVQLYEARLKDKDAIILQMQKLIDTLTK